MKKFFMGLHYYILIRLGLSDKVVQSVFRCNLNLYKNFVLFSSYYSNFSQDSLTKKFGLVCFLKITWIIKSYQMPKN